MIPGGYLRPLSISYKRGRVDNLLSFSSFPSFQASDHIKPDRKPSHRYELRLNEAFGRRIPEHILNSSSIPPCSCGSGRIRTPDLWFWRPPLSQAELHSPCTNQVPLGHSAFFLALLFVTDWTNLAKRQGAHSDFLIVFPVCQHLVLLPLSVVNHLQYISFPPLRITPITRTVLGYCLIRCFRLFLVSYSANGIPLKRC